MDKIFKKYGKEKLEEAVKNSNSFVEATRFLGLDPINENDRKNVMRSIKNNNIFYYHFKTINRITEFDKEKISILIEKCDNYVEILKELKLPISYSEKLRNYLYRNKMSFSYKKKLLNSKVWNKEILIELIKESKTQSEVLNKMKLRSAGSNFYTLKKYIKLFDIDTSHFIKNYNIMINFNTIPLYEILVENSTFNRNHLKERLYKESLKDRKCELCGQDENWNGKKMSLILDHKNGIHNDNRIENLRIVCPNCNATLNTHCGKNIKKPNK
jgi:hypothetical protein